MEGCPVTLVVPAGFIGSFWASARAGAKFNWADFICACWLAVTPHQPKVLVTALAIHDLIGARDDRDSERLSHWPQVTQPWQTWD